MKRVMALVMIFSVIGIIIAGNVYANFSVSNFNDWDNWKSNRKANSMYRVEGNTIYVSGDGCDGDVWHQFTNTFGNSIGISGVLNVSQMTGCSQVGFRQYFDGTDGNTHHYHFNVDSCGANSTTVNIFYQKKNSNYTTIEREDFYFDDFFVIGSDIKLSIEIKDGQIYFYADYVLLKSLVLPSEIVEDSKRRDLKLWLSNGCESMVEAQWKSIETINEQHNPNPTPSLKVNCQIASQNNCKVDFSADVTGGVPPYSFFWDFDADGTLDKINGSNSEAYTYNSSGRYYSWVHVIDSAGKYTYDSIGVTTNCSSSCPFAVELKSDGCSIVAQVACKTPKQIFWDFDGDGTMDSEKMNGSWYKNDILSDVWVHVFDKQYNYVYDNISVACNDIKFKTQSPSPSEDPPEPIESCGAYVAPGVWKEFDCYNLAAIGKERGVDPFTPSWELIGGYWQWGRKGPDPSQWYDTNTKNFAHGPTGDGSGEANAGSISGWDISYASDGSWSDATKTANDPCSAGYRVPTKTEWRGVIDNNSQSNVGTWDRDDTNYSSARFFGDKLMLPAAGSWNYDSGSLGYRGYFGGYWSSTETSLGARNLHFSSSGANTYSFYRRNGFSVRCIAE